jgi:hypothetical protein
MKNVKSLVLVVLILMVFSVNVFAKAQKEEVIVNIHNFDNGNILEQYVTYGNKYTKEYLDRLTDGIRWEASVADAFFGPVNDRVSVYPEAAKLTYRTVFYLVKIVTNEKPLYVFEMIDSGLKYKYVGITYSRYQTLLKEMFENKTMKLAEFVGIEKIPELWN